MMKKRNAKKSAAEFNVAVIKKVSREVFGSLSGTKVHKSKKIYDRNRIRREDKDNFSSFFCHFRSHTSKPGSEIFVAELFN